MGVSVLLGRALAEAAENAGVDRQALLAASHLDPTRLDDPDGRLEIDEYDRLQTQTLALTGEPAIGLRIGEAAKEPTFNLLAHVIAYARTLRDGIDSLLRFQCLLTDRPVWRMLESVHSVTIVCDDYPGPHASYRLRTEMTVGGFYRLVRYFVRNARPERISFNYPAPSYREEYARVFGGLERFEQRVAGITLSRELLDVVQPNHDPETYATLETQAVRRLQRLSGATRLAERVYGHVIAHPRPEERCMDSIARALGMSPRSLRRKLQAEGTSFQQIVEGALGSLSRQHLSDADRSVKEIAILFGFADQASFCRAFKRWSGTTPTAYRAAPGAHPSSYR